MTPDNIKAIFQGLIAVVVIIGGGVYAFLRPDNSQAVWGVIGTVVAYYFLSATQSSAIRSTISAMTIPNQAVKK